MAYQTYTTDALVIGSQQYSSADKVFILFTRELGLVFARAVSVRAERSKLRYALQEFSLLRASLVRGKQGWRIIGAENGDNLFFKTNTREVRGVLLRIIRSVRRLVRGEERNRELYDTLVEGLKVLSGIPSCEISRAEYVLTLRVLASLGYVAPNSAYQSVLASITLQDALSITPEHNEARTALDAIESAFVASQL